MSHRPCVTHVGSRRFGSLVVTVNLNTAENPDDRSFRLILDELEAERRRRSSESTRLLVLTDGGAPSTKQRGQLSDAMKDEPITMAAVSHAIDNPIKRGVATAFHWLNPRYRVFGPTGFEDALVHLGVEAHRDQIWQFISELEAQFVPLEVLRLIRRHGERSAQAEAR